MLQPNRKQNQEETMRNYQEINVLKETRKNASMAVNAIDALMRKIYNQEFAYELTSERNRFRDFERKAEAGLRLPT